MILIMSIIAPPADVTPPTLLSAGVLELLQTDGAMAALKDAASGRYLWANGPYLAWLGSPAERVIGATDLELLPQADANAIQAADARSLAAGMTSADDHRFERGGQRTEFRALRQVIDGAPGGRQILSLWRDVTQARRDALQVQHALGQIERQQQAFETLRKQHAQGLDRPSELFRREHFEEHLRREVALSQRESREFALVLIAVEGIDTIRRERGESAVQLIVDTMGHLMRTNTRAMDVLAQLGDARFAILLSGVGLATAHSRMEHLRRACATHVVVHEDKALNFEVSIGVASFPHTAKTLSDLSQAAMRALHDARQRGGNRVALASIRLGEATVVA